MTLPIKLIATDFDGTLFAESEDPPVSRDLEDRIAELQGRGAKWVINTGRDMISLLEALAGARLSVQPDFLVVVEREIHVQDGGGYVALSDWNARCRRDHEELFVRVRPDVARLGQWVHARFRATVYEDDYSPFCLIAGNSDDAEAIHAYLDDYSRGIPHLTVVRNDVYTRFSHIAYNKGTALAELARQLGATRAEVFAAGDHLNDLPMLSLEYAQWLVAPHNAIEEVKTAVRRQNGYVSRLCCGAGVADGLRNHLRRALDS